MVTLVIIGWIGMFLALSWAVWPREATLRAPRTPVAPGEPDARASSCSGRVVGTHSAPVPLGRPALGWLASRRELKAFRAELDKL